MSRLLNVLATVCLCLVLLPASLVADAHVPVEREARSVEPEAISLPILSPTVHTPPSTLYVPGEVIVKLRDGAALSREPGKLVRANQSSLGATLMQVGVHESAQVFPGVQRTTRYQSASPVVTSDLTQVYRLKLDIAADVMAAVAALSADPNIEYAEPNYIARAVATPNDSLYSSQWGLAKISATSAWDVVTGMPSVVIAVVDSGLDMTHPDLAGQLWTNPGEIPGNGIDDDNNGYVDDMNGWNFVAGSNNVADDNGHGTQVAGVAGAATNNGQGIAGVCWNCRIMPVKVMQGGVANYSDIAVGVVYAANKGAKVINLSVGGYADSATLRAAIEAASATAVIVGGAGNDGVTTPFYPAAYDDVLAVAATTITDTKTLFSNYGAWVSVSAPGEAITTTFLGGDYGPADGTSLAAPFAAGLAGLLRSLHPDWSPALVSAQIIHTTDNIDNANPGYEGQLGSGRIDAGQAVATTPMSLFGVANYAANSQTNGVIRTGTTVTLTVTLRNDWGNAADVTATLSTTDTVVSVAKATASYGGVNSGQSVANTTDPFQISVSAGAYGHTIPFHLNVVADSAASMLTFTATTESATVTVGGTLTSDTVWTNDRIYLVTSNLFVGTGVTLTIQPGTLIKFNPGKTMVVQGTLIATGTLESPIHFTSNAASPARGDWDTIEVRGNAILTFGAS